MAHVANDNSSNDPIAPIVIRLDPSGLDIQIRALQNLGVAGLIPDSLRCDDPQANCRNSKNAGERSHNESVEGNWVIPCLIQDRRQRLPEGFGYLVLFSLLVGASVGALGLPGLRCWLRFGINRPTDSKSDECHRK
jgi:hypothetical protein